MPEIKSTFIKGRMNLDLDERLVPNGEYKEALNIQVSTSDNSDVGSVKNILGNQNLSNFTTEDGVVGELICIGSISDEKNNKLYWLIVDVNNFAIGQSVDASSAIVEYDVSTRSVKPIVVDTLNTVLEFNSNNHITGINIVDDFLFWTDNVTEPKKINIKEFSRNNHTNFLADSIFYVDGNAIGTVTKEDITVIKKKPTKPPVVDFIRSHDNQQEENISMRSLSFSGYNIGDTLNINLDLPMRVAVDAGVIYLDTSNNPIDYTDIVGNIYPASNWPLTYDVRDATGTSIDIGDVLLLSDPTALGVLPNNAQIRLSVNSKTYIGGAVPFAAAGQTITQTQNIYVRLNCTVLTIDPNVTSNSISFNYIIEDLEDVLFDRDFPRFAYRYKYNDGEYSAFGPFTQVGFETGAFSIHPTREPYNAAMQNSIKTILLRDFVTHDIPKDVVEIDVLYKPENSNVVYSLDTIKPVLANNTNNPAWHSVDGSTSNYTMASGAIVQGSDTGYYRIKKDIVYAAIPEDQLLRPWDNVPKKAKSQDFTANRLIYGNYIQNLNLGNYNNNLSIDYEKRTFGPLEILDFKFGHRSIKSQRTYQSGISFLDLYGRETPVFTSGDKSSVRIPFNKSSSNIGFDGNASSSNRLIVKDIPTIEAYTTQSLNNEPYCFKLFVKETSSEYYNLVLDRVYKAEEDGNLWLSFPSSDRNKLQEDDFIILKKELETDKQVELENKFKVIDIKNEAPEFIRTKYRRLGDLDGNGDLSTLYTDPTLQPAEGVNKLILSKDSLDTELLDDLQALFDKGDKLTVSFKKTMVSNSNIYSQRYNIVSLTTINSTPSQYVITLDKAILPQDAWVETSPGVLDTTLKTEIYIRENEEWEEFQGRFFVKILSNIITAQYLEPQIDGFIQYILSSRAKLFALIDSGLFRANTSLVQSSIGNLSSSGVTNTFSEWEEALNFDSNTPTSGWFVDAMYTVAQQPTVNSNLSGSGGFGAPSPLTGAGAASHLDASCSGSLFKAGNGVPGLTINWVPNTYQASATGLTGVWTSDGSFVDGLDGIVQADGTYNNYTTSAHRAWRSQRGGWADYGEEVYGGQGSQGYYMHLSYSGVGTELHDGGSLVGGMPPYAFYDASALTCEDFHPAARLHLQSVVNQNTQGSADKKVCNVPSTGYNPATGQGMVHSEAAEHQWDPIGHVNLNNFNQANKDIVQNLVVGSKFRFANDSSNTIFTIINVTEKRLYNHTSWNRSLQWNPTLGGTGGWEENKRSVHYYWHKFVERSIDLGSSGSSTVNWHFDNLKDAIVKFGSPSNRRVCYVLELDKDPSDLVDNPETLGGPSTSVESTFMEFIEDYNPDNATVLSDNPAIFETEPKENLDLDIYYESSQAYPLSLDTSNYEITSRNLTIPQPDNRKGYLLASVYDRVRCTIDAMNYSNYSATSQVEPTALNTRVKSWDGDIVELDQGLLRLQGVPATTSAQTTGILNLGGELQFHKKDGSYVQLAIVNVLELTPSGNQIIKVQVDKRISSVGLSYFNCYSFGNGVESNRIRDDFNRPFIKNGVKASTILQEQYKEDHRSSGLIFSGLYNKNTSLNSLNQFIMADSITKELEPTYGSIQKLYARDSDLIALCEDKIVQIAADKDILFNADGNPQLIASNKVLGQSRPFVGEYGISKNPESFAKESYRAYFTDKQRGAVLRLSMDGLTAISDAGMTDWFRDKFKGNYFNIVGSYDTNKDSYNLTFDSGVPFYQNVDFKNSSYSITASFKENVKGWDSFKSFIQESGVSCVNTYFTFRNGQLYSHDSTTMNNFYGSQQSSFITNVFNDAPTVVKNFNTLNYDGEDGWVCDYINTDLETGVTLGNFLNKENKYFASVINDGRYEDAIDTSSFGFQGIGVSIDIINNI